MSRWAPLVLSVGLVFGSAVPGLALPEDGVTPVDQYTTAKGRNLATTYLPELLRFSENVYHCLPWVGVVKSGIGFRQPKSATADDRYLSVWISIDQADDGTFASFPLDRRVSAMFSRYGVDMLKRMTQLGGVTSDPNVTGFSVILSWLKPDSAKSAQPLTETLALFVDTATLREFLAKQLPAPEFTSRARYEVFEGKQSLGRVPFDIWEDNFNSTFKLKGYELAKGQKC